MHCWKSFTTKAAILLLSLTSCLEGWAQTRAVVYATNDFHLSPTNLLISNLLQGSNIVVQYTNLGKIWLHGPSATDTNGLATTNYVQDATNTLKGDLLWLEQFGSANLTNWGLLPTNTFDWKYQPGNANLTNWAAFTTNVLGNLTNNSAFARTNIDNTFIGSNMFAGPLNGGTNVLIGPAYPLFANSGNALTVNSNTLLVTSNRVGISTNAPGCTLDINAPYGANVQFQVCTGGVPVLVLSNGYVGVRTASPTRPLDVNGAVNVNGNIDSYPVGNITAAQNLSAGGGYKIQIVNGVAIDSPALSYMRIKDYVYGTNGCALIFPSCTNVTSTHETATNTIIYSQGTNLVISDSISPGGGVVYQGKQSFYTNYTITTNTLQIFNCNGTGQVVTLPNAGSYPWNIFRFSSTNGYGNFTLTNATGAQTIRDGTNLFLKQIGVGEISLYSDGAAWWLASKAKTIFPNASWSTSTNIICTADIITNIGYNTLEFNNSQGIALVDPSKIYITNFGQYLFTYSAVVNGGGNNTSISIWLRQSGVDVVRTRTRQVFTSATAQQCLTVNYIVNVLTNNTYFELVAASHDTGAGLIAEAANPTAFTAPAAPSIIITVNRVSDSYP